MTKQAQKRNSASPVAVSVHLRGAFDGDFEAFVERRIRYAFAQFGSSVRRIRVDLTQALDGAASCRLQLHGLAQGPLVVVERDRAAPLVLQSAIDEAAREVARRLGRDRVLVQIEPET